MHGGVLFLPSSLKRIQGDEKKPIFERLVVFVLTCLRDVQYMGLRAHLIGILDQLVKVTGYVSSPYEDFPRLLPTLIELFQGGPIDLQLEVGSLAFLGAQPVLCDSFLQASLRMPSRYLGAHYKAYCAVVLMRCRCICRSSHGCLVTSAPRIRFPSRRSKNANARRPWLS